MGSYTSYLIEKKDIKTGKWLLATEQDINDDLPTYEDVDRNYHLDAMLIGPDTRQMHKPFKFHHDRLPDNCYPEVYDWFNEGSVGFYTLTEIRKFNWERKAWFHSNLNLQDYLINGWVSGTSTEHRPYHCRYVYGVENYYIGVRKGIEIYHSLTNEEIKIIKNTPLLELTLTVNVEGKDVPLKNVYLRTFWSVPYRDLGYKDFKGIIDKMESLSETERGDDVRVLINVW